MIMPFINRAAAKAVSLEESVFMCVSERRWLLSILTGITQQGPCQLQTRGKRVIWKVIFIRAGDPGDRRTVSADKIGQVLTASVARDPVA
jgi:hypothetical protein